MTRSCHAAPYSMTSSARAMDVGGMSRPIAFGARGRKYPIALDISGHWG
jgi:hypothetical protein